MIKKDLYSFRKKQKSTSLLSEKLNVLTRQKIQYQFSDSNHDYQIPEGMTDHLYELQENLLRNHGWSKLKSFDKGKMVKTDIRSFVLKCSEDHLFDCLEIYYDLLDDEDYSSFEDNINKIFSMDNIGYEYKNGKITPIVSEFLHEEIIAPTISLLRETEFEGPLEEFEEAIKFFKQRDFSNVIHYANKSFESTLKAISNKKEGDPKDLIKELIKTGILESYYEGHLDYLRKLLLCLPITRHKKAGHGQGKKKKKVDRSYAELALHLAGTFIVFLIKRYKEFVLDEEVPF